jgi:glycosyltransferase involved in cell wall biosynthesis
MAEYSSDKEEKFRVVRVVRGSRMGQMTRFFFALMKEARNADLIYTLDWLAAGMPVMKAAFFLRIPYLVRIGGDYAWDTKYLEVGGTPMTLRRFYESGEYLKGSKKIYFQLVRLVLRRARHVVYNSEIQRELYEKYFDIKKTKTSFIPNPIPLFPWSDVARETPNHEFVFMGRLVAMKNVSALVRAFAKAKLPSSYSLAIIGDGPQKAAISELIGELGLEKRVHMSEPLRQHELYRRVKDCRAFVLPSWTDISPNNVYEALSIGLPVLMTKENYLGIRDKLPAVIDPSSVEDIAQKLEMLSDDARYAEFSARFKAISFSYSWDDATRDHMALFERCLR